MRCLGDRCLNWDLGGFFGLVGLIFAQNSAKVQECDPANSRDRRKDVEEKTNVDLIIKK